MSDRVFLRRKRDPLVEVLSESKKLRRDLLFESPMDHTSIEHVLADDQFSESMVTDPDGVLFWSVPNRENDLGDVSADAAGNLAAGHATFTGATIGGEDVAGAINGRARGVIARINRTNNTGCNPSTSSSHNQAVMRLEWTAKAGYVYTVMAMGMRATSDGTGTQARFRLTQTTDGTYAHEGSPIVAEQISGPRPDLSTQLPMVNLSFTFPNTVERQVSTMLSYSAFGGVDNVLINPTNSSPFQLTVWESPLSGVTGRNDFVGTVSAGTTPPAQTAAPKEVLQTWRATAVRSWNSDGSLYKSDRMYQGVSPYYSAGGRKSSHAVFGTGDKGQSIPTAMAGASEILDLTVGIYFQHWHPNSGGYARLSYHNSDSTSAMPALSLLVDPAGVKVPRNSWLRLKITDPAVIAAFLAGDFEGLGLNATSDSSSYYGYASGSGDTRPWIACRYITN